MGYGITGGLRDYESMQFGGLKDKYYSSGLIWRYDNENEPELVGSRCRSLKYSARTVSLWGTCTKTGPVKRNGAYKRSRLRSLPERWTALFSLSLPFYLPLSLFLSYLFAALSSLDRIVRLRSTAVTKQRPPCVLDSRVSHVILLSSSETGPPSFPPRCPRSRANHRPRRRKMPIYYLRSFLPPCP